VKTHREILESMSRGEITGDEAVRQLIGIGEHPALAREAVSIQKNGTDIFEEDPETGKITPYKGS
jgi:hypothetical protein